MLPLPQKWSQSNKSQHQWSTNKKQTLNKCTWGTIWLEIKLAATSSTVNYQSKEIVACNQVNNRRRSILKGKLPTRSFFCVLGESFRGGGGGGGGGSKTYKQVWKTHYKTCVPQVKTMRERLKFCRSGCESCFCQPDVTVFASDGKNVAGIMIHLAFMLHYMHTHPAGTFTDKFFYFYIQSIQPLVPPSIHPLGCIFF